MIQSSQVKLAYRGCPLPMSLMSSTRNGSTSSNLIWLSSVSTSSSSTSFLSSASFAAASLVSPSSSFVSSSAFGSSSSSFFSARSCFSSSSSFFSSSFFFSCTFLLFVTGCFHLAALLSPCLLFHSASLTCHSSCICLKYAPGWMSSTRCVSLRSEIQALRYSAALGASCQAYRTSSKPSALSGMEKLAKERPKSFFTRSSEDCCRNHWAFSSSAVSCTASSAFFTAASMSSSGSSAGSASSSFFSAPSSPSAFSASSAFFSAAALCLSATATLRFSFLACASASFSFRTSSPTFRRLASKAWLRALALNASGGSPMITTATRLNESPS
mmetsp:Transcript_80699/g.205085  ORF Transcript_80699/g.205085 Transcript_80699/m.205085 type:complete len:329 (+) Transcript_80699:685-1671(+)